MSSLVLNAALLLSCFSVSKWARYVLVVLLIPSAFGVAFIMTDYHAILAVLSLMFYVWVIIDLLRQKEMV